MAEYQEQLVFACIYDYKRAIKVVTSPLHFTQLRNLFYYNLYYV